MDAIMEGLRLTKLKIIPGEKGNIMHALKNSENCFEQFGEAYFTFVNKDTIKGWKKHKKMVLNLVVPVGEVKFVFYDDRENSKTYKMFFDFSLSPENYYRLTVEPGLWMAFKGVGEQNLVLNIAGMEHDPTDTTDVEIHKISYQW